MRAILFKVLALLILPQAGIFVTRGFIEEKSRYIVIGVILDIIGTLLVFA